MRPGDFTVHRKVRAGDALNEVTLAGEGARYGELIVSAETAEPTVLLTLTRNKLLSLDGVKPQQMDTVALNRYLMFTPENLDKIGLAFLAADGKEKVMREMCNTAVIPSDKTVVDASKVRRCRLTSA